jgi:hypothetical protein
MKKLHDIEITVCPELLSKQKQFLFHLMDDEQIQWTDEGREHMDGLLNLIDFIEDQIMFRDDN